jgi:hypothetical protein
VPPFGTAEPLLLNAYYLGGRRPPSAGPWALFIRLSCTEMSHFFALVTERIGSCFAVGKPGADSDTDKEATRCVFVWLAQPTAGSADTKAPAWRVLPLLLR